MFFRISVLVLCSLLAVNAQTTHEFDFKISWLWMAPDGYYRPVITVNNQFPAPLINVTEGDTIIAKVRNELWTDSTSIHWHGFFLEGAPDMDGSPGKETIITLTRSRCYPRLYPPHERIYLQIHHLPIRNLLVSQPQLLPNWRWSLWTYRRQPQRRTPYSILR